jgi:hypothetical protein
VGTDVEKHVASHGHSAEVLQEPVNIQDAALGVIVAVGLGGEMRAHGDLRVVGPSGTGQINVAHRGGGLSAHGSGGGLTLGGHQGQHLEDDTQAAGAAQHLGGGEVLTVLGQQRVVFFVHQLHRALDEGLQAVDGRILMVHGLYEFVRLLHALQDQGLIVVVAVSARAQINLLGTGVVLEHLGQSKNLVRGSHLKSGPHGTLGGHTHRK